MKNLFNPKWILLVTTFPTIILALLFYRSFTIIESLLDQSSLAVWKSYSIFLFLLTLGTTGYSFYLIKKQKVISVLYALITLASYFIFLYGYGKNIDLFVPWSIPNWMIPESLTYYVGCFLMPTLLYALILIVLWSNKNNNKKNPWYSLLYAICIPITIYVFSTVISPLWNVSSSQNLEHIIIILGVFATIIFLFFIIQWAILILIKKEKRNTPNLALRFTIGIVFPMLGLAINNGLLSGNFYVESGLFGDFTNYWFYALALINGIFLCLNLNITPNLKLIEFLCKSAIFPFILYFFLVFMPYLPLSLIAIIAFGLGFLMLTPIILFIVQIKDLVDGFQYLGKYFSKIRLAVLSIVSMAILPLIVTFSFIHDKQVLVKSLDKIYSPDYSNPSEIDINSLASTLKTLKQNRKRTDWFFNGSQTPFISSYFSWLVLDNMTLANSKIRKIENVFFGISDVYSSPQTQSDTSVTISNISSSSTYDMEQDAWESWIDLELTNNSSRRFAEFGTKINLPEGCWINDYYLFVEGKKEMGILAEKKSAMWVYSQIRNTNRDPGILNYISGNEVAFRVFPFSANETRKTGIKFIHKEPLTIQIENKTVSLGDPNVSQPINSHFSYIGNEAYISAEEKKDLPKVSRTPYFHFIVDASIGREAEYERTISKIDEIIKSNIRLVENSKITFTNFNNITYDFNSDWRSKLKNHKYEGGFFLENTIKKILFDSFQSKEMEYPRIVVISENLNSSIISKNFADLKIAFPESDHFYTIDSDNHFLAHSLIKTPKKVLKNQAIDLIGQSVLAWPNAFEPMAFLPDNNKSSIALKASKSPYYKTQYSNWETALYLQGQWISQNLHPEISNEGWLDIVKGSFESRILTPLTSFIVVENEAQKAILKRKQKQVLKGNKNFDLNGDIQAMSEPRIWIICMLLLLYFFQKNRPKPREKIKLLED